MGEKALITIDHWLDLPDDARSEMIEGELVYKALPSAEHSFSATKLGAVLDPFNRKKDGGGGPGGWWIGTEPHVLYPGRPNGFIHDLAGWRRDRHAERPTGRRITMTPDWVCEIVSSNRGDDLVKKKRVLHEHRVGHYWLLDHRDGVLVVMRWVEGGYLTILEATTGEKVHAEPFEAIELDVGVLLGDESE